MNRLRSNIFYLLCFLISLSGYAKSVISPSLSPHTVNLVQWQFSKDKPEMWTSVKVPHSCNALDGHSAKYFRGKSYYRTFIDVTDKELSTPMFLLFEGAAQASKVNVNGKELSFHKGGYTPFVVSLKGELERGQNEILVECNNKEDLELIPISSDFNKNNGLHNPVHLLEMNSIYASPIEYGMYRIHVSTPFVSDKSAKTDVRCKVVNDLNGKQKINIILKLIDADGKITYTNKRSATIDANSEFDYSHEFKINNPHLWNGVIDPYLYKVELFIETTGGKQLDYIVSPIGYRYYKLDADNGFFLNGKSYPLRGVAMHQDWDKSASALSYSQIDRDYELVKELGTNFLRLAHYPHNDYSYRKCDEMGIIVQAEIPWVNVCGVRATDSYFKNINAQMHEMVTNLCNHPSIVFWGMWNELDTWGNNESMQGKFDAAKVVKETNSLYEITKKMDPYRYVGITDCTLFDREGYSKLKGDFYSDNRYNGWYYNKFPDFTREMNYIHDKMGVVNISEYGVGVNPFCHSLEPATTTQRGVGGKRHDEEYGNILHESHLAQIVKMPFINFTSIWIMFDFPVADRLEGYMDSDDGINFTESQERKFMNDKGLVTRDRKTKKDAFYLYKSFWNKNETTVYITSRRFTKRPANEPIEIKVYSNAKSLSLFQNGKMVQKLNTPSDETGVIWKFNPIDFENEKDSFTVVSDNGTKDEAVFEKNND